MATIKKQTVTDAHGKSYIAWRVDGIGPYGRKPKEFSTKKYGADSKKFAEKYLNELQTFELSGETPSEARIKRDRITFGQLADMYNRDHLQVHTRSQDQVSYLVTLKNKWGMKQAIPKCEISRVDFRAWIWHALERSIPASGGKMVRYSASSIIKLVRYASRVFNWGVSQELLPVNPLSGVLDASLTKELRRTQSLQQKSKEATITASEFWAFAETLPEWLKNPVILAWCTGMRVSELKVLKWSMISGSTITLTGDIVKEAHTKEIVMEQEAIEMLNGIRNENIMNGIDPDYVFRNGGRMHSPMNTDGITHQFRLYADNYADLTGDPKWNKMTPHKLRSSFATRKIIEGAAVTTVSRQLGHHSTAMTDRYSKTNEDALKKMQGIGGKELYLPLVSVIEEMIFEGFTIEDIQAQARSAWINAQNINSK